MISWKQLLLFRLGKGEFLIKVDFEAWFVVTIKKLLELVNLWVQPCVNIFGRSVGSEKSKCVYSARLQDNTVSNVETTPVLFRANTPPEKRIYTWLYPQVDYLVTYFLHHDSLLLQPSAPLPPPPPKKKNI